MKWLVLFVVAAPLAVFLAIVWWFLVRTPDSTIDDRIADTLRASAGPMSAAAIGNATGCPTARLYPALARLERQCKVTSDWADEKYPRRRLYRLAENDPCPHT